MMDLLMALFCIFTVLLDLWIVKVLIIGILIAVILKILVSIF